MKNQGPYITKRIKLKLCQKLVQVEPQWDQGHICIHYEVELILGLTLIHQSRWFKFVSNMAEHSNLRAKNKLKCGLLYLSLVNTDLFQISVDQILSIVKLIFR